MELIENIEKISKLFYITFMRLTFVSISSSSLIITAINYFIYDLKDESYYLSFPVMYVVAPKFSQMKIHKKFTSSLNSPLCRLPFNWKTPLGYSLALLGFFTAMYATLLSNCPIVPSVISSCWLIITFITDIKNELSQLNATVTRKVNQRKFKKRLCVIIQQFSVIKQLSESKFCKMNQK